MHAKLIICAVANQSRTLFHEAQLYWSELAGYNGFRCQFGGWDRTESKAIILSFWNDKESLCFFMKQSHDEIVAKSNQNAFYQTSKIIYIEKLSDIVRKQSLCTELPIILRLTDCKLQPGQTQKFLEVQADVWNPGMAQCDGFCRGSLWKHSADSHRFVIQTLWSSVAGYKHYTQNVLPLLKAKAELSTTIHSVTGYSVELERKWTVI